MTLTLEAGAYRLTLDPDRGGSIASFTWNGAPLFRATCGPSVLDSSCFPLVPFSNRIAFGRLDWMGHAVELVPNMPGSDHPHVLHGFGWLVPWVPVEHDGQSAILEHRHAADAWPWSYAARQHLSLTPDGLTHRLDLTNTSDTAMPAGLGFHPYFPMTAEARYRGLHRGEWLTSAQGLPLHLDERDPAVDWWDGAPVHTRAVDTVYTGRTGALEIEWPDRGIALTVSPSENLPFTVVYTPAGEDFFCVEPVSHATDPFHRNAIDEIVSLAPGTTMTVDVDYAARPSHRA